MGLDQIVREKSCFKWAVVVAQLAERSHLTPEIRASIPDISNILNLFICQLLSRKDENKEEEAGNGPFKKVLLQIMSTSVTTTKNNRSSSAVTFLFLVFTLVARGFSFCCCHPMLGNVF